MLCQKCGLTEATVHREFTVFRQKIEEHLCELCAGVGIKVVPRVQPATTRRSLPPSLTSRSPADLDLSIPPDPKRPGKLALPARITVLELAARLRLKPFKVVAILMMQGVFATLHQEIEFAQASAVCRHCGVTAEPAA